jgi:hypothetical protein
MMILSQPIFSSGPFLFIPPILLSRPFTPPAACHVPP